MTELFVDWNREERRKMQRKVGKKAKVLLASIDQTGGPRSDDRIHAKCGHPLVVHQPPDYTCPIGVIDDAGIHIGTLG